MLKNVNYQLLSLYNLTAIILSEYL